MKTLAALPLLVCLANAQKCYICEGESLREHFKLQLKVIDKLESSIHTASKSTLLH